MQRQRLRHSIDKLLMPARNNIGLRKLRDARVAGVRRAPLRTVTRPGLADEGQLDPLDCGPR
jgi:hypothetical protein